jgi:uncharacterized protein YfaP (DUF2135 family)
VILGSILNMLNRWKSAAIAPVILFSSLGYLPAPAAAQESQGCFLINDEGRLRNLTEICPGANAQVLGTGDIQVTLEWTSAADLDVSVSDPQGDKVAFDNPQVRSGGMLDVDANAGCFENVASPVENVFWPTSKAPQGNYKIQVNLFDRCTAPSAPVSFTIKLLVLGTTQTLTGTVDPSNPIATFPFSVPVQAAQQ